MTPTRLSGAAIWHSRMTTAESIPPLRPTANPRAPAAAIRCRSHAAMSSAPLVMAGSLHRGSGGLLGAGPLIDDAKEGVDERRIELARTLPLDLRNRVTDRPGRLVGTLLRQGVEHVGDSDDAAGQRYRIA